MIVSASSLVKTTAQAIPAIERYDGVFMRVLRKCVREGLVDPEDILVVSPVLGMIRGLDKLPYRKAEGSWHDPRINRDHVDRMNRDALLLVKNLVESRRYPEVYVNIGKKLQPIIAGIGDVVHSRIVYAEGSGLGPKAAHMRDWIHFTKAAGRSA